MACDRYIIHRQRDRVRAETAREHESSGREVLKVGWTEANRECIQVVEETLALLEKSPEERWRSSRTKYSGMLAWLKADRYRCLSPQTRGSIVKLQSMLRAVQQGKLDISTLPERPFRPQPRHHRPRPDLPAWLNGAPPPIPSKRSTDK